jgi:hypothetical protein
MSSADKREYGEDLLIRYLLGSLTQEESERLDELSIADDEFAWRLKAVENDMVYSFLADELSGEILERFRSVFLASPRGREKILFARTLRELSEKSGCTAATVSPKPARSLTTRSNGFRFGLSRWSLPWGLGTLAVAMCILATYLFVENNRLRKSGAESREQQAILDQRTHDLEKQLTDERSVNTAIQEELESLRRSLATAAPKTIAALLLPATRGINQIKTVVVHSSADRLALRLQLEADEFPAYLVTLKDPGTNQSIWNSANLKTRPDGSNITISINISASMLRQQNYTLEVSGVPARGGSEFLSNYPFRVVFK